jgi:UDP-glucose 4-epimerase
LKKHEILIIGGAGYIGSHMVRTLLDHGLVPVVFDNLTTGHRRFVPKDVPFIKGDLRNSSDIERVFRSYKIKMVIHFSAASLVQESMTDPLKYYNNNVISFVSLLATMRRFKVKKLIFSSTAAVYGESKRVPIQEHYDKSPANPYGRSKLMMEKIIEDAASAYGDIQYIIFRYFNVAGARGDGAIGEVHDPETHLIPNILKAAKGERKDLTIFGDDYPTKDGTCVRDYIHVQDLVDAHFLGIRAFKKDMTNNVFNLGTQNGYSNLEVIRACEQVTAQRIAYTVGSRRPGDPAKLVASSQKAKKILGWEPKRGLLDIVQSAWQWERHR